MAAFIDQLQVSLMAAPNANENIRRVVLAEVRTETALSILNCFHVCSSYDIAVGEIITHPLRHSSMSFVFCKLRPKWSQKLRTNLVVKSLFCDAALLTKRCNF
jgi:hypothetical protein